MRLLFFLGLLLPISAYASFILQYGLHYSSQTDGSSVSEFEESKTFHNAFLGASVDGKKRLFFGWNINSWSSSLSQGTNSEDTYSLLEMGPKLQWFTSDQYNLYLSAEWNPYAQGEREKSSTSRDISGSSIGLSIGYRFRLSKLIGLGASLKHHTLNLKEEKIGSSQEDISDKVSGLIPMLELSIITK